MNVLIIGGAGFIGINAAKYYLDKGSKVTIYDNLHRKNTDKNIDWLKKNYDFEFVMGDILDYELLSAHVKGKDLILHLAAQVAVTTSVVNPREDFEINAIGTFNVLEAAKNNNPDAILIYSSTNKVYGGMEHVETHEINNRYEYKNLKEGVSEDIQLDFHSPYGCSKGCADQYFIDYSRIYGLKTIVFRQSCIYGTRQFGVEDQGWVAWFTIASLLDKKLTIYGDGKQIRDVLFVEDLIEAYDLAAKNIGKTKGQAYNIGGGPKNTLSLLELLSMLKSNLKKEITYSFDKWRPGDQPVFVCDISKAKKDFGWEPKTDSEKGVNILIDWVKDNSNMFE